MECVLLYGSETWTIINKIAKSLDGCYTCMLRKVLDVSWKDHITNKELYEDLLKITTRISKRRLHCKRSEGKIISELVTWRPTQGRRSAEWPTKTFVDLLRKTQASPPMRLRHACRTKDCGKPSMESVRRCRSEWVGDQILTKHLNWFVKSVIYFSIHFF